MVNGGEVYKEITDCGIFSEMPLSFGFYGSTSDGDINAVDVARGVQSYTAGRCSAFILPQYGVFGVCEELKSQDIAGIERTGLAVAASASRFFTSQTVTTEEIQTEAVDSEGIRVFSGIVTMREMVNFIKQHKPNEDFFSSVNITIVRVMLNKFGF